MKRISPAILVLILTLWGGYIQASSLGFGSTTFSKDTLNYGDTLFITTHIINYSTSLFTDSIAITFALNNVENVDRRMFPNPVQGQLLTILPHDSVILNLKIIISPSYFDIGPDILVIWPIAPDDSPPFNRIDSLIYVEPLGTGVIGPGYTPQLKAYYFNKEIFLQADAEIVFNRVRISDLTGRQILNQYTDGKYPVPFGLESDGIYFVEIYYNEGQTKVCKIVK